MRYRFDNCEFDTDAMRLIVSGVEIAIQPQVADVLRVLIEERPRVVSKEELLDRVWGHTFVTESALTSRIKSARQAVGDDGKHQRLIRTVHGRGYQFLQDVVIVDDAPISMGSARLSAAPLPTYSSELVGRVRELDELRRLIDESALVTIVGPGGVGKTRLAVACAGDPRGGDVVFVDLTTVRDPALVVDHIAAAMGLHIAGSGAAAIAEYVGERRTLLVVDNVEHVIDAAAAIGELVGRADGLTVLATSRERLRVDGERVFTLDPLPVRARSSDGDAEPTAAFELFVRTIGSIAPDLDVERYRRHIDQICASVEGLPLAIELVAGQTRALPPDMLAARLGDRLRSASTTRRDLPERHRTMAETIDWSLRLLDGDEHRLFARTGAFVGEASVPLIEAVCCDEHLPDPIDVVTRLVDKSLVRSQVGSDGEARFGMLDLLRARATELLWESDEGADVVARHAQAIADAVDAVDAERWRTYAADWTDRLTTLLPEFRRAHDVAVEAGDWELAGRLAASYGAFWHREGGLPEGLARIRACIDHVADLRRETRGRLLAAAGLIAWDVGDVADARMYWLEAAQQLEHTTLEPTLAYVLAGTAVTAIDEPERHDWAAELLDQAVSIAQHGPPAALAEVLNMRGEFARATGDDAAARAAYEGALRHATETGSVAIAPAMANLAYVECHVGNFERAQHLTRAALRMSIANGRRLLAAWSVGELAISAHGLGDHELAARLLGAAKRAMDSLDAGRYPADVREDELVTASLIGQLGADEFDRLVAEGATLPLDRAAALALGADEAPG